ncbi:MAG: 30S ribosomal protein S2 [bacterium]
MALISLRQLLECGAHFGHPTRKWNPKMAPYIFTKRNGIHILDLQQTTKMVDDVHDYIVKIVSDGGKILFIGTKKQAQEAIEEEAVKCGMPFINQRWLGGMLTNFRTIRQRVQRLKELRRMKEEGYFQAAGKKEAKILGDELARLEKFLRGIVDMEELPQALFIIDVKKEENAIKEARRCKIPVIGILDSNCDPDLVDKMIIGNDDAIRSIKLFCQIVSDSVLEAKHGFLPPDSVLIQGTVAEEGEGLDENEELAGFASAVGIAPKPKPAPEPAPTEISAVSTDAPAAEPESP